MPLRRPQWRDICIALQTLVQVQLESKKSECRIVYINYGGIYDLNLLNYLRWDDIRFKFHDDRFRQSTVVKGNTHTDTRMYREQGGLISQH
jgi:hypothetical protein